MKPKLTHQYFGYTLWRNTEGGFRLRWSCQGIGAADTLSGMKRLIREHVKTIP